MKTVIAFFLMLGVACGFMAPWSPRQRIQHLKMGIFDSFKKAFANEEVS